MSQIFNPFLPLDEYIADGEPHVFGDRLYVFGSHDKAGGQSFCLQDYVFWSAPLSDLSAWTNKGTNYSATQDPLYGKDAEYLYAPDVVRGKDGRYYLYYCLAGWKGKGGYTHPISVAVSDQPDGKYHYLGYVKDKSGHPLMKYVCFDPAVILDEEVVRLYYGTWYPFDTFPLLRPLFARIESMIFGRDKTDILHRMRTGDSIMGPIHVELEEDMMTAKSEPVPILPLSPEHSAFSKHPFFEGSSIRKINGIYYFVYSSLRNHELCYATSRYPDHDFVYGGTIISNGDIGFQGRKPKDRLNSTGTNHGSIVKIKDKFYVFYHRLTHLSDYSRQLCAEEVTLLPDGSIPQAEMTSCGLNQGPLNGEGVFPAVICCNLTDGHMRHGSNHIQRKRKPCIAEDGKEQFIRDIQRHTLIVFKYFRLKKETKLTITYRGKGEGCLQIKGGKDTLLGTIRIQPSLCWKEASLVLQTDGYKAVPLCFFYLGNKNIDLLSFSLT